MFPEMSWLYHKLGLLSPDGKCRAFDASGNGYGRSEAVVVLFLQRRSDAKRVYASIIHSDVCCGGDRHDFITPTQLNISRHLQHFYDDCGVDPASVSYFEADGSASKNNDFHELNAIDEVLLHNRSTPLLIGSVKSNIGHTESASSLCSIAKVLIAMQTGHLPPNLNYTTPRSDVPALADGRLQVVTETLPWTGGLAAINVLGIDGNVGHTLLRSFSKVTPKASDSLPRLVVASSRTEEGLLLMLSKIEMMPVNTEFVRLIHDIHSTNVHNHLFRGYTILSAADTKSRELQHFSGKQRPVWFIFSGMGSQWPGMARHLMHLPVFAAAIDKCHNILKPMGLDLLHIVTSEDSTLFDNIMHSFVGITAIQIGLVDILHALDITADGMIGHSLGELGCGYADNCLTAEQAILSAYSRGRASLETDLIFGHMAAVGLGYQQVKSLCPPEIDIACHNGPTSCTLSGPAEAMQQFVAELKSKGIFVRVVNTANKAYHSRYMAPAAPKLLKYLKEIIPECKPRSSHWISTSVPEHSWGSELARLSSPEYYTNNLLNAVLFEEGSCHIPSNAICIEIAPHGLLQAVLRRSLSSDCANVPLTQRGSKQGLEFLLAAVGKLYLLGLQPQLAQIFPPVTLPVSQGTPSISPLVAWEHTEDWPIISLLQNNLEPGEKHVCLSLSQEETQSYSGHMIAGQVVVPPTVYLKLVLDHLASMLNADTSNLPSVIFEDVLFHETVFIQKQGSVELHILLQRGGGDFEVLTNKTVVASGKVTVHEDVERSMTAAIPEPVSAWFELSAEDVYHELQARGYQHAEAFRGIISVRVSDSDCTGKVKCTNNWVAFTDALLQLIILLSHEHSQDVQYPSSLQKMIINSTQIAQQANGEVEALFNRSSGILRCSSVELHGLQTRVLPLTWTKMPTFLLESLRFLPHLNPKLKNIQEFIEISLQLALENCNQEIRSSNHVAVVELSSEKSLTSYIKSAASHLPTIQVEIQVEHCSKGTLPEIKANCILVVASSNLMREGLTLLSRYRGFLLTWVADTVIWQPGQGLVVVTEQCIGGERLLLLRKVMRVDSTAPTVMVTKVEASWVQQLTTTVQNLNKLSERVILVCQNDPPGGISAFLELLASKCNLNRVRFVCLLDKRAPPFSLSNGLYYKQLLQDLVLNVYQDGAWGSYRSLPSRVGAKPSLKTFVSPPRLEGIEVSYIAMSPLDPTVGSNIASPQNTNSQITFRQLEFAGVAKSGQRLMGIAPGGSRQSSQHLMWPVPDDWSLEDAVTVPLAFATAYYTLMLLRSTQPEDSVLIHSGHTPIGQAAISVALSTSSTIYTSAFTSEQRRFLKKRFPQLETHHILSCKDISFEAQLMQATAGKGVSLVLNNLSGDKMDASVRCLDYFGHFVHLGQSDLIKNNSMGTVAFLKSIAIHGVTPESLLDISDKWKDHLHAAMLKGIDSGVVQPIGRKVFQQHQISTVLQLIEDTSLPYKLVIKVVYEREKRAAVPHQMDGKLCFQCNSNKSYLIFGGKGEYWLSLLEWLVKRGARKVVIAQQSQPVTNYLARRVGLLHSCHAADVVLTSPDKAATTLIKEATAYGPLAAVFMLPLENSSSTLKAISALDVASRSRAPEHFVCLLCPGAERLCESRRQAGLPAVAVLGLVLNMLDELLMRNPEPVIRVTSVQEINNKISDRAVSDRIKSSFSSSLRRLIAIGRDMKRSEPFIELPSLSPGLTAAKQVLPIFMVPGLQEASDDGLKQLASRLMYPTLLIRLPPMETSIKDTTSQLIQHIRTIHQPGPYILVGELWGGALALELASQLELSGEKSQVFLLDGTPQFNQATAQLLGEGDQLQVNLICRLLNITSHKIQELLLDLPDWTSRVNQALSQVAVQSNDEKHFVSTALATILTRVSALIQYRQLHKVSGPVTLIHSQQEDNLGFIQICTQNVNIHSVGEDHNTMLESKETSDIINSTIIT